MKMNRKYRPKSWSQQAREMSDRRWFYYISDEYPEYGEKDDIDFFQNSYRAPRIRHRAAKRFGRMVRKYKRKEK